MPHKVFSSFCHCDDHFVKQHILIEFNTAPVTTSSCFTNGILSHISFVRQPIYLSVSLAVFCCIGLSLLLLLASCWWLLALSPVFTTNTLDIGYCFLGCWSLFACWYMQQRLQQSTTIVSKKQQRQHVTQQIDHFGHTGPRCGRG